MKTDKRKYIESHWLVFGIKGAIALIAGLCLMLTTKTDTTYLTTIVGITMLAFSITEIMNTINRKRLEHNWGFSLAIGMVEFIIALCLLCTIKLFDNEGWNIALRIPLLSVYTAIASILSIFIGFTCFKDKTDRFMWIVMGMVGCVLGFIMLGASGLSETAHIQLFGTYLLVKGLTDLIFGIHSRNEIEESTTKTRSKKAKGKK